MSAGEWPHQRRWAIEQSLREAEGRAPIVPVMGLGYTGLGDLVYDALYDASEAHCREHLEREPSHDETMEVVAASYALVGAPIFGFGGLDLRDPWYLGWARFSAAIAHVANEQIGFVECVAAASSPGQETRL